MKNDHPMYTNIIDEYRELIHKIGKEHYLLITIILGNEQFRLYLWTKSWTQSKKKLLLLGSSGLGSSISFSTTNLGFCTDSDTTNSIVCDGSTDITRFVTIFNSNGLLLGSAAKCYVMNIISY